MFVNNESEILTMLSTMWDFPLGGGVRDRLAQLERAHVEANRVPGVTLDNFEALRMNMSYNRVVEIFGVEGTLVSRTGADRTYSWDGYPSGTAILMFDNMGLWSMTQNGLR